MAIEVAHIRSTQLTIPLCILPMVMRMERESFVADMADVITAIDTLYDEVRALQARADSISESLGRIQKKVDGMIADAQPIWNDDYNLCGDPQCDGWCTVCRDGEYLGEDDYEEKYCRRGKR